MNIDILVQNVRLEGELEVPQKADSLVIFTYGVGSNQSSIENSLVESELRKVGVATLLFGLMTEEELKSPKNRFDIELMTDRLIAVTKWCIDSERLSQFKIGYFGSNTESAAALSASAYYGTKIKAVVTVGGRPELSMEVLDLVESPTLFIVGGEDKAVIDYNRQAYQKMGCIKKMEVISGAHNLFEEEDAIRKVADLTTLWFIKYM